METKIVGLLMILVPIMSVLVWVQWDMDWRARVQVFGGAAVVFAWAMLAARLVTQ